MKRLLVCILILAGNINWLNACGYYPFGEDLRFGFLSEKNANLNDYRIFNYSKSNFYGSFVDDIGTGADAPNVALWQQYCRDKVDAASVQQAVYAVKETDVNASNKNKMLQFLFRSNDHAAIDYLIFAKQCERFTAISDDSWERNEASLKADRSRYIALAVEKAGSARKEILKKRYAFLAIRLSFYNSQKDKIKSLYDQYFSHAKNKDLIDYWALYFYIFCGNDAATANYLGAQVFAHASDKRYAVISSFNRQIAIEEVLKLAKTPEEKANIRLLYCIRKPDRNLGNMIEIYKENPASDGLQFLLLREINKIEDWILTPQYSLFLPSQRSDYWENSNATRILQRVEVDRDYAKKVLGFVNTVDFSKVSQPDFWQTSKAYLLFLTKDYNTALPIIEKLLASLDKNDKLYGQVQLIKALCLTANQENGHAVIPEAAKKILIEQQKLGNNKYVFAIGRELEMKGNTAAAALLYAKASADNDGFYAAENDEDAINKAVYWKGKHEMHTLQDDYFYDSRGYIDAIYTPEELNDLIGNITNAKRKDAFDRWLYDGQNKKIAGYYDLLGMKYIRQDKLPEAAEAFVKMDKFGGSGDVFITNPLFSLKNTLPFVKSDKNVKITKAYIAKQLIACLSKAENPNEPNRDYYYFLAANGYYNMTYYGSATEMRRIFRSSSGSDSGLSDEKEYTGGLLAQKYYRLAFATAKSPKFKALCLRLIGQCEKNKFDEARENYWYSQRKDTVPARNFIALKTQYPEYYNDLIDSECSFFKDYFDSRNGSK